MKKLSLLAFMTAVTIAGSTVLPVHAADVKNTGGYVIKGEKICSFDDLRNILSELCNRLPDFSQNCKPETDTDKSETDTDKPETDTDKPDTETVSYAEKITELVNAEREKAGLKPLVLDMEITSAAQVRAKETETLFSHTRPDGRNFTTALSDIGFSYRGAGENIAWGQRSPEQVMEGWMNSEGHRANILNSKFTKIGVGYYQNVSGTNYWTQLFTY